MPHFLTGDELGTIKSIHCTSDPQSSTGWKLDERNLFTPHTHVQINSGEIAPEKARESAIQRLAILNKPKNTVLAAAKSNGTLTTLAVDQDEGKPEVLNEWKESRYKPAHKFVGLNISPKGLFWCTSNGALGRSSLETSTEEGSPSFQKASLPMRLCAWQLSPDSSTFAYGGDEVDLSIWDTERTFQSEVTRPQEIETGSLNAAKKRKREGDLFPAEIWRAKNLPNDALNLRQPIHITSLSYLSAGNNGVHLVTGTESGDVRRYDTRAARRPVANWTCIAKVGGIGLVQAGLSEHELLVSDSGTNLSALDLRNGRTIYSYKKLQGAVTSLAQTSTSFLGSTSRDRYFRLHSTFPPPAVAGAQQEERGEVLGALYMKSVPTAVVSSEMGDSLVGKTGQDEPTSDDDDEGENDVWAGMQNVDESDDEEEGHVKAKRKPRARS